MEIAPIKINLVLPFISCTFVKPKTNIMGGLNYGNSYKLTRSIRERKEGVTYMPNIQKYLVRIKKNGIITTICAYKRKCDADKKFAKLTTKNRIL
jgi:hypothetical protein